jgi:NAD(P)-dependent dehydrogenase (short-subunit alcohol dehydrogenase family)
MNRFKGKAVIVMGVGSGIGAGTCSPPAQASGVNIVFFGKRR